MSHNAHPLEVLQPKSNLQAAFSLHIFMRLWPCLISWQHVSSCVPKQRPGHSTISLLSWWEVNMWASSQLTPQFSPPSLPLSFPTLATHNLLGLLSTAKPDYLMTLCKLMADPPSHTVPVSLHPQSPFSHQVASRRFLVQSRRQAVYHYDTCWTALPCKAAVSAGLPQPPLSSSSRGNQGYAYRRCSIK